MPIEEIKKVVDVGVVRSLENALEMAKRGEVRCVAIALVTDDCSGGNCFAGGYYPAALIGELRLLERDIMDEHMSVRRQVSWEFTE